MPDFDDDLRSLAGHAQHTGRLDPAATIRRRADVRRRRRYVTTGALGVLLVGGLTAGIAVLQPKALPPSPPATSPSGTVAVTPSPSVTTSSSPAPTSSPPPSSAPPTSSSPSTPSKTGSSSTATGAVFDGTRQVYLLPENNEAGVAVDTSLKAGLSEAFDDRALFVLSPSGGRYQIKTAKIRVNDDPANETYCLAARSGKVVATACDSSDTSQLFYVLKSGTSTSGKPTYVIRTRDYVFLRVATPASDLTASKIEEGTADAGTDFLLPDQGKASLPALD
jgi:hypothetical protein